MEKPINSKTFELPCQLQTEAQTKAQAQKHVKTEAWRIFEHARFGIIKILKAQSLGLFDAMAWRSGGASP